MPIAQTSIIPKRHDFSDISEAARPLAILTKHFGEDLAVAQLVLEHEAYTQGEERFLKNLERASQRGEVADNVTAKPLLQVLTPKMAARFTEWYEGQRDQGRGRKHVAYGLMANLESEVAALITIKVTVNELIQINKGKGPAGNATQGSITLQSLATRIGVAIEEELRYGRIRREEQAHFKAVIDNNLKKRNGPKYKVEYMKAVEESMIQEGQLKTTWEGWGKNVDGTDMACHVGIKLLELLIESTGLVEVIRQNAGNMKTDHESVQLRQEWTDKLIDRAYALSGISPVFQPCVVPPKKWTGFKGGGYWASGRKPINLIRTYQKRQLERYRDVHMPEVIKAVNLAQESAWCVNHKVLEVINSVMSWDHVPVESFPTTTKEELPLRPDGIDDDEVILKGWKKEASKIYRRERARESRRLSLEFTVSQANKFAKFDAIYFPYNMDWRGRVYAIPTFNPQGSDLTKGLLKAAHGKPIGEEGMKWLAIHGANCAGVDKVTFPERLQWIKDNESLIYQSAMSPLDCTWWAEQDSPWCFLAFCFEWLGVRDEGINWVSSLPVAFDGSCSGIQHFSAMLRDERGGKAVNLVPSESVQDIYRLVADAVNARLQQDILNGSSNSTKVLTDKKTGEITELLELGTLELSRQWLEYGVTRSVTKRSVMTLPYGSKEYGFADQVLEDTIRPAIDSGKGTMFTIPAQAARYIAKLIWESVSVTVVAAVEAMEWLQSAAKLMAAVVFDKKLKNPDGSKVILKDCLPISWVTPDGFPVWQEYNKPMTRRLDLMFLGSIRLQPTVISGWSNEIDAAKQESGVAPNFVHSQDGSHLRKTVVKANEAYGQTFFALIHDSFGGIPAEAGGMFRAVRETMVETYEDNDVLLDFSEQFSDQLHESQVTKMPALPAHGTLDIRCILESDFAFA